MPREDFSFLESGAAGTRARPVSGWWFSSPLVCVVVLAIGVLLGNLLSIAVVYGYWRAVVVPDIQRSFRDIERSFKDAADKMKS